MKIAKFMRVSQERFAKDLADLCDLKGQYYDNIKLPQRATSGSAGYDFCSPIDVLLGPKESVRIPTGIRCKIDEGYVLELYPRSSFGFKYQMGLLNTTGIIDADYFNADNEGHIIVGIINRSDKPMTIKAGERFVQGIFLKYYLAEEEEVSTVRHGGFGSTDSCAHSSNG
ncbi:MAG: dUTP diphosphatase [Erysipelotrichaceae bacterium]|nr:dUTP diphosphatase [Erysipelotrichaceae bacterium]